MFFGKFILKITVFLTAAVLFVVSLLVIIRHQELKLIKEFDALSRVDPLVKARKLEKVGKVCEALEYMDLFKDYAYVRSNPKALEYYQRLKEERESYSFRGKQLWDGVWRGTGDCPEALISATVTDFLVIGDIRDLVHEEIKRYYGQDADEFTEALAGVGIILTGVTVMTGGTALPAKGSVSVLKIAKKLGRLSRPLQKSLMRLFRIARKTGNLRGIRKLSTSLYRLGRVPHLRKHFFFVISKCDSVKDITRMEKVAAVYGKRTVKFLKLGGDAPISIAKKFRKNKALVKAMDKAVQYGPRGARLVKKTGPKKFLKYLRITKFGVRAVRSAHKGRLLPFLKWVTDLFPTWLVYVICGLSGIIVLGSPLYYLYTVGRLPRRFNERTA